MVSMCEQGETCTIDINEEFYLTKCIRSHQNNLARSVSSGRPWVKCQDKMFIHIEEESCGRREKGGKNPFKMYAILQMACI